jgi:predicted secreted protein
MRIFVDQAGFHHQEEAGLVLRQEIERGADLLGQVRLLRKFPDGSTLEELAVERTVHITQREQTEQRRERIRPEPQFGESGG